MLAPEPHQGRATTPAGQRPSPPAAETISPELLYLRADQALYQAKRQGRNRVVVWQEDAVAEGDTRAAA
jgi:GGDEF domain-containing protein